MFTHFLSHPVRYLLVYRALLQSICLSSLRSLTSSLTLSDVSWLIRHCCSPSVCLHYVHPLPLSPCPTSPGLSSTAVVHLSVFITFTHFLSHPVRSLLVYRALLQSTCLSSLRSPTSSLTLSDVSWFIEHCCCPSVCLHYVH